MHGYIVDPRPRAIAEFEGVIADSFSPKATFMNAILLVRFDVGCTRVVRNMMYTEIRGAIPESKALASRLELIQTIVDVFSMPRPVVETALDGLSLTGDAWN